MDTKKFLLQENDIPRAWYNIVADMKNKPMPPLHPGTKKTAATGRSLSDFCKRIGSSGTKYNRCMDRNTR